MLLLDNKKNQQSSTKKSACSPSFPIILDECSYYFGGTADAFNFARSQSNEDTIKDLLSEKSNLTLCKALNKELFRFFKNGDIKVWLEKHGAVLSEWKNYLALITISHNRTRFLRFVVEELYANDPLLAINECSPDIAQEILFSPYEKIDT
jgi:hypothetical protein